MASLTARELHQVWHEQAASGRTGSEEISLKFLDFGQINGCYLFTKTAVVENKTGVIFNLKMSLFYKGKDVTLNRKRRYTFGK